MKRTKRAAGRELAGELRAQGMTWTEISAALRERWPEMTALRAARNAHGWSLVETASAWEQKWPEQPPSPSRIGEWEHWPVGGRRPSLDKLCALAQLYEVAVTDLLTGVSDHRHLDANATQPEQAPGSDETGNGAPAWAPTGANLFTAVGSRAEAAGVAARDAGLPALAEQCFRLGLWCAKQANRAGHAEAGNRAPQTCPDLDLAVQRLRTQIDHSARLLAEDATLSERAPHD